MQPDQQQRIMGYFIEEAKDHLNTIEQGLLNLQSTIEDPEMVNEVFRAAHSVKGGAAMLGLNSIQRVSHRLEDYFKVLKEAPIRVDQKLENLFLRVFDALQALLGQLQSPFGLTEDAANTIVNEVEPTFAELEQYLNQLAGVAPVFSAPVTRGLDLDEDLTPAQDEALLHWFKADVPLRLREMLQLFKQPEADTFVRHQLQEVCRSLGSMGEQYGLDPWCYVVETARRAIAHPDNSYRILAPIVIKDIKLAQELVLAGRTDEIAPCAQLQNLVPVAAAPETIIQDDFDDLLTSDLIADDVLVDEASDIELPFEELVSGNPIAADDLEVNLETDLDIHQGPEVGMAELNSLADLFEGEMPDLNLTWQQEEVVKENSELSGEAVIDSQESTNDFADLLFEGSSSEAISANSTDDLIALFGDDLDDSSELSIPESTPALANTADLDAGLDDFADLLEISDSAGTEPTPDLDLNLDEIGVASPEPFVPEVDGLTTDAIADFGFDANSELSLDDPLGDLGDLFDGLNEGDLSSPPATTQTAANADLDEASFGAMLDDATNSLEELAISDSLQPHEIEMDASSLDLDFEDDGIAAMLGDAVDPLEAPTIPEPLQIEEMTADSLGLDFDLSDFAIEPIDAPEGTEVLSNDSSGDSLESLLASDDLFSADEADPFGLDSSLFDELTADVTTDDDVPSITEEPLIEHGLNQPDDAAVVPDPWGEDATADFLSNSGTVNGDRFDLSASQPELETVHTGSDFDLFASDDSALEDLDLDLTETLSADVDAADIDARSLEPVQPIFESDDTAVDQALDDLFEQTDSFDALSIELPSEVEDASINALQEPDNVAELDFLLGDNELNGAESSLPDLADSFAGLGLTDTEPNSTDLADLSLLDGFEMDEPEGTEAPDNLFDADSELDLLADLDLADSTDDVAEPLEIGNESAEIQDSTSDEVDLWGPNGIDATAPPASSSDLPDAILFNVEGDEPAIVDLNHAIDSSDDLGNLDELLGDDLFPQPDADLDLDGGDSSDDLSAFLSESSDVPVSGAVTDFGDLEDLLDSDSTDAFANLDSLLDDSALAEETVNPNAALEELESISSVALDVTPSVALDVDDFSDLESLLSTDALDEPAEVSGIANDSEFDDLNDLLKEAEEKMGGSPTVKVGGGITQMRRTPRPSRVFSEQTMRVPVKHLDNLSNLVGELVVNRNSLEQDQERLRQSLDNLLYQVQQLSDVGQRMQDLYERSLLESSLLASRQGHRNSPMMSRGDSTVAELDTESSTGIEYDPLEMDRFTGFHSLSQEMIELIVRVRESSSDIEFIVDETEQVTRMFRQVTTQLQEGLTRSRMVPFAQTADRLPRAVRDISMKVGKQAELVIEGRETLIDKMILEQLYDPMTHLVNNAITHGIESPSVRMAAGKPAAGRITIRAFHQGNQTIISVSDDGAGIDVERVKAKALEKGLLSRADLKNLSRLDVYDILFHPGFTTKDQADDFSGRGVGMDVVRTSLSDIRGVINTDSTPGKGTSFTIRLPLTLSISKALCCISDRARIAFPMDGVEDMLDVPKDRIQINAEGQPCITWRDTILPVRPLAELLGYNRHLSRGNVYGGSQDDDMVSIVVLRSTGNFLALEVDQVMGEQEIVIKQLEGPVPKPVGVAGATVLGDGRIMPIADVLELIDLSMGRIRRDSGGSLWEQGGIATIPDAPAVKTEPMVLIVDDSITVRELLSMTFNKVGYRVEQARDGQEAWEKLRSGLPCDIVFCDIEMPRMDGLELLSRIQKDANLKHLPIAMLTSRGADRHRQMAASLGASGYFTKPYLEEALLDAAQRMLKGERLLNS